MSCTGSGTAERRAERDLSRADRYLQLNKVVHFLKMTLVYETDTSFLFLFSKICVSQIGCGVHALSAEADISLIFCFW